MEILLSGIVNQSITDGPGLRMTIFTQGCPHACEGCHNPETWSFENGENHTVENLLEIFDKNPLLNGMTFSGGEPLCQPKPLKILAEEVRRRGKNIICYTGYTFEEIQKMQEEDEDLDEMLSFVDILIDGPFVLAERDLTLPFRGSGNQRILDLPASLKKKEAVVISL